MKSGAAATWARGVRDRCTGGRATDLNLLPGAGTGR
jgi:hypothetical protein